MTPIIQVQNVSKYYKQSVVNAKTFQDELALGIQRCKAYLTGYIPPEVAKPFKALNDVSFDVMPGEVVGIVGSNGAGKSTLLKLLSRITMPTKGQILMHGRVASLLEVGTGFHPELTGRENIFMNGAILGMKRREIINKLDDIIEFAEIGSFIDVPVKRYSSGMYVKLAFSVGAHLDPEILIVDEVLAVGDIRFQRKCLKKMQEVVQKSGRTILFVSHNLQALSQLCPKSILLENGRLVKQGNTTDILACYDPVENHNHIAKLDVKDQPVSLIEAWTDSSVPSTSPLQVNFGIIVKEEVNVKIWFKVFHEGTLSFTIGNLDKPEIQNLKPGRHLLNFLIPGFTLNPGSHAVDLFILLEDTQAASCYHPKILGFKVIDTTNRRGLAYSEKWQGACYPDVKINIITHQ